MLSSAPSTPGSSASISFFPPLWAASTPFTFSMVSSSVILSHVPFKCHTMESKHDSRAVNTPKFSSVGKVTHLDQKNGLDSPTRYYCDAITCIPLPKGEYQYWQKLHVNTAPLFQVQKSPFNCCHYGRPSFFVVESQGKHTSLSNYLLSLASTVGYTVNFDMTLFVIKSQFES